MSTDSNYREQFDRVKRWYDRFSQISQGKPHDKPSDFYQDDVYAFFLNCYHLKDWIRHDPSAGALSSKVEAFINATPEMTICADICNGLKHLTVNKPRSTQGPKFGPPKYRVGIGSQPTTIAVEYAINTTSGPIDAFALATTCMKAWEAFLT